MKYQFERDWENGTMTMAVVDARRFGVSVRAAMRELERTAQCYGLTTELYYQHIQSYLDQMAARLETKLKDPD